MSSFKVSYLKHDGTRTLVDMDDVLEDGTSTTYSLRPLQKIHIPSTGSPTGLHPFQWDGLPLSRIGERRANNTSWIAHTCYSYVLKPAYTAQPGVYFSSLDHLDYVNDSWIPDIHYVLAPSSWIFIDFYSPNATSPSIPHFYRAPTKFYIETKYYSLNGSIGVLTKTSFTRDSAGSDNPVYLNFCKVDVPLISGTVSETSIMVGHMQGVTQNISPGTQFLHHDVRVYKTDPWRLTSEAPTNVTHPRDLDTLNLPIQVGNVRVTSIGSIQVPAKLVNGVGWVLMHPARNAFMTTGIPRVIREYSPTLITTIYPNLEPYSQEFVDSSWLGSSDIDYTNGHWSTPRLWLIHLDPFCRKWAIFTSDLSLGDLDYSAETTEVRKAILTAGNTAESEPLRLKHVSSSQVGKQSKQGVLYKASTLKPNVYHEGMYHKIVVGHTRSKVMRIFSNRVNNVSSVVLQNGEYAYTHNHFAIQHIQRNYYTTKEDAQIEAGGVEKFSPFVNFSPNFYNGSYYGSFKSIAEFLESYEQPASLLNLSFFSDSIYDFFCTNPLILKIYILEQDTFEITSNTIKIEPPVSFDNLDFEPYISEYISVDCGLAFFGAVHINVSGGYSDFIMEIKTHAHANPFVYNISQCRPLATLMSMSNNLKFAHRNFLGDPVPGMVCHGVSQSLLGYGDKAVGSTYNYVEYLKNPNIVTGYPTLKQVVLNKNSTATLDSIDDFELTCTFKGVATNTIVCQFNDLNTSQNLLRSNDTSIYARHQYLEIPRIFFTYPESLLGNSITLTDKTLYVRVPKLDSTDNKRSGLLVRCTHDGLWGAYYISDKETVPNLQSTIDDLLVSPLSSGIWVDTDEHNPASPFIENVSSDIVTDLPDGFVTAEFIQAPNDNFRSYDFVFYIDASDPGKDLTLLNGSPEASCTFTYTYRRFIKEPGIPLDVVTEERSFTILLDASPVHFAYTDTKDDPTPPYYT